MGRYFISFSLKLLFPEDTTLVDDSELGALYSADMQFFSYILPLSFIFNFTNGTYVDRFLFIFFSEPLFLSLIWSLDQRFCFSYIRV